MHRAGSSESYSVRCGETDMCGIWGNIAKRTISIFTFSFIEICLLYQTFYDIIHFLVIFHESYFNLMFQIYYLHLLIVPQRTISI